MNRWKGNQKYALGFLAATCCLCSPLFPRIPSAYSIIDVGSDCIKLPFWGCFFPRSLMRFSPRGPSPNPGAREAARASQMFRPREECWRPTAQHSLRKQILKNRLGDSRGLGYRLPRRDFPARLTYVVHLPLLELSPTHLEDCFESQWWKSRVFSHS